MHHNQTSEVLNCAAWEAGIFPAGEREVFAHTQEEVEAIGLEEQATSGDFLDALEPESAALAPQTAETINITDLETCESDTISDI